MVNGQIRMTNDESNPNVLMPKGPNRGGGLMGFAHSSLGRLSLDSSFIIRHSSFC
jgi:hypothetical protein